MDWRQRLVAFEPLKDSQHLILRERSAVWQGPPNWGLDHDQGDDDGLDLGHPSALGIRAIRRLHDRICVRSSSAAEPLEVAFGKPLVLDFEFDIQLIELQCFSLLWHAAG